MAGSSLEQSLVASSTDESTVSPPPSKYLRSSTALVCRAGREPMQSSPDKSNIQEDMEEDRQSNCSSNSQRLIEVLHAQLSSRTAKAAVAVCVAAAAETKLQLVSALSPNPSVDSKHSNSLERDLSAILGEGIPPSPIKLRGASVQGFETPRSNVYEHALDQSPLPKFNIHDDNTSAAAESTNPFGGARVPAFPDLNPLPIHDAGHPLHSTMQTEEETPKKVSPIDDDCEEKKEEGKN